MRSVTHRVLDGSTITIRAPVDLDHLFSTYVRIDLGFHVQEFGAGPGDFASSDARDIGVKEFHETYQFQGGTLRVGFAHKFDPSVRDRWIYLVAVWEGAQYSLSTYTPNASNSAGMLATLNQLRLIETPEGLVATPVQPDRTPIVKTSLMKDLPRLRLIDIRRSERNELRAIPNWSGQHVEGGELFLVGSHEEPRGFVLAGDTAVAYIRPEPDDDLEALLPTVSRLSIDWVVPADGSNEEVGGR